jgi:xanthine dehydrogenase FAD-binding subunit
VEKDVKPRDSWRATKEFRLHVIRTLTQRVVRQAVERAGGKF